MSYTELLERSSPSRDHLDRLPTPVALGAVVAGVTLNFGIRGEVTNAVLATGLLVVIGIVFASRRVQHIEAQCLAGLAVVPVLFLVVRASPCLAVANLGAFGGLVGASVLYARSGSVLDTNLRRLLRRTGQAGLRALRLPLMLAAIAADRRAGPAATKVWRIGRAGLVAFPLLALVVALLASDDAVFARLLVPDVSPGPVFGHVLLVGLFSLGALLIVAAAGADTDDDVAPGRFGAVEVFTMLILAAGVVGLFVISQLVALTATGERLLASSGLTPAEYARSGFFQLCWATAVLIAFLGLVRALAGPGVMGQLGVRLLAGWVPFLALGLVAVCLRRMALYDQAFGLTMLRLAVVVVTIWLGILLILIAVRNLRPSSDPSWVLGASAATALALIL